VAILARTSMADKSIGISHEVLPEVVDSAVGVLT
jgi:hypothetical protein